jgi:DNA-binding NtrC family response regulator
VPGESSGARERDVIAKALAQEDGNVSKVSVLLGIPKRTLYRKIEKYKIDLERYRIW